MLKPEVRISRRGLRGQGYDVWIDQIDPVAKTMSEALPIQMREVPKDQLHQMRVAPLSIEENAAQQLMDDLWEVGLRPTEGSGSAGSLASTQKHLQDMRTIAFNKLEIKEMLK